MFFSSVAVFKAEISSKSGFLKSAVDFKNAYIFLICKNNKK